MKSKGTSDAILKSGRAVQYGNFDVTRQYMDAIISGTATEPEIEKMTTMINKIAFVNKYHTAAIYFPKGKRKGWTTYVGKGKERRPVQRKTKEDLYEYLYEYYKYSDLTLQQLFDRYLQYRKDVLDRSAKTIEADTCNFYRIADKAFRGRLFGKITEDDWRALIVRALKTKDLNPDNIKRFILIVKRLYDYAARSQIDVKNVSACLDYSEYYKSCKLQKVKEQIFTEDEQNKICNLMWSKINNPRAQMILLSAETGMRIGELAALHWEDIEEHDIHICRQQILDTSTKPHHYFEVNYTKDERRRIPEGRWFPITVNIRIILEACRNYQNSLGLSFRPDHVFCDSNGMPIKKDTAGKFLKRCCKSLNIEVTHNHAFRKSLNSNVLEAMDISPQVRAYILGHSVRINLMNYSCKRRENAQDAGAKLDTWNASQGQKRALARSCSPER